MESVTSPYLAVHLKNLEVFTTFTRKPGPKIEVVQYSGLFPLFSEQGPDLAVHLDEVEREDERERLPTSMNRYRTCDVGPST